MFRNLQEFLAGKAPLDINQDGQPSSRDLQVAVIGLLAQVAKTDSAFGPDELRRVVGVAFRDFGLTDVEGAELLEVAEFLMKEKTRVDEFVAAINANLDDDQRMYLFGLVWRVICADGKAEKSETMLAADLRKKLNLSLEQGVRAQQMADKDDVKFD